MFIQVESPTHTLNWSPTFTFPPATATAMKSEPLMVACSWSWRDVKSGPIDRCGRHQRVLGWRVAGDRHCFNVGWHSSRRYQRWYYWLKCIGVSKYIVTTSAHSLFFTPAQIYSVRSRTGLVTTWKALLDVHFGCTVAVDECYLHGHVRGERLSY